MNRPYKTSRYNYFINYRDKILLFNGISGTGFCMKEAERDLLLPLLEDLDRFSAEHPSDFERLLKLGFIVDANLDEIALIKYHNKKVTFNSQKCSLTINPTVDCNFRCWYCYENHRESVMSEHVKHSICLYARHMIEEEKVRSFNLSWFGGEPLLYFNEVVYPISKYIKNLCAKNNVDFFNFITTNGYCINPEIAKKLASIDLKAYQITLDGNRERHNKIRTVNGHPTFDKIIQNIELLCNTINDITITLRINYDKVTLECNPEEILNEFSQNARTHIYIDLQRVWQTKDDSLDERISNQVQSFLEESRLKGYKCSTSSYARAREFYNCYVCRDNYKLINYDGYVFKCTAQDFTPENAVGKLNQDGVIDWYWSKIYALYGYSPLESKECLECNLLPLCMGPCPQNFWETGYDVSSCCPWHNNERAIDDFVIDVYENAIGDTKK